MAKEDTNMRDVVIDRFNISLTWLDLKRVQWPVPADDKRLIDNAITSGDTKFIPGWLNDAVTLKKVKQWFGNKVF